MSGDRSGDDRSGGEADRTGVKSGGLGIVVREILAKYCDPKEINSLFQVVEPSDYEENIFLWSSESTLQIRSTWKRRLLPEETKVEQSLSSDDREPDEGHRQDRNERNQPGD